MKKKKGKEKLVSAIYVRCCSARLLAAGGTLRISFVCQTLRNTVGAQTVERARTKLDFANEIYETNVINMIFPPAEIRGLFLPVIARVTKAGPRALARTRTAATLLPQATLTSIINSRQNGL